MFRKAKIAVFVDGCYWHGCPEHHTQPATNSEYWSAKIGGNVARDRDTTARLAEAGWTVLCFWEHEDLKAWPTRSSNRCALPSTGLSYRYRFAGGSSCLGGLGRRWR